MKHILLSKRYVALAPIVLLLLLAFAPQSTARAADGTNGTIDLDITSVVENTLLSVRLHGLDASSDYNMTWTDSTTTWFYEFTTGASQTELYIPIKVSMPPSGNTFVFNLTMQSAGTEIDSYAIFVTAYTTFLDLDMIIGLAVPILIMVIFAGIIVGLIVKFK